MRNTLSIQARAEKRKRTVVGVAIGCVVFATMVLNFFLGDMGYLQFQEYLGAERELQREIRETRAENATLVEDVEGLDNEGESVERLARESLDMMRDGEVVFKFRKD